MAAISFRIIDLQNLPAPPSAMHDCPASGYPFGGWCDLQSGAHRSPGAMHTAVPWPIHWQEQMLSDLKRDEAVAVIERFSYDESVS